MRRGIASSPQGHASDVADCLEGESYESLFRAVFDMARNPMALIDETRRFLALNPAAVSALGFERDELIERSFDEVVEMPDRAAVDRAWRRLIAERSFTGQTRVLAYDGSYGPVSYAGELLATPNGRVALVAAEAGHAEHPRRDDADGEPRLSEREREIVRMLADGKTGAVIADELYISPLTVQTHVRNAMRKLGALTRVHLVALALQRGLL